MEQRISNQLYDIQDDDTSGSLRNSLIIGSGILTGTYVISCVLTDLLSQFEVVQQWRYLWPLIGIVFMIDGYFGLQPPPEDGRRDLLKLQPIQDIQPAWKTLSFRATEIIGGIGMVIGGAYDAFMPVWMTGPNVFTPAGIGQDASFVLFWLTLIQVSRRESARIGPNQSVLDQEVISIFPFVVLLAELYKLGEGSFDEVWTNISQLI